MKKITTQELENLSQVIEKGKTMLGKAEGKLENLENQKAQLHQEILQYGVSPENLKEEILKMDQEISAKYEEIVAMIPQELFA